MTYSTTGATHTNFNETRLVEMLNEAKNSALTCFLLDDAVRKYTREMIMAVWGIGRKIKETAQWYWLPVKEAEKKGLNLASARARNVNQK